MELTEDEHRADQKESGVYGVLQTNNSFLYGVRHGVAVTSPLSGLLVQSMREGAVLSPMK